MTDLNLALTIQADGGAAKAELDRVRDTMLRVAGALTEIQDEAARAAQSTDAGAKKAVEGFQKLKAQTDEAYAAALRFYQVQKSLNDAVARGTITQAEAAQVLANARAQLDQFVAKADAAKVKAFGGAVESVAVQSGNLRGQAQNAAFQVQDLAVQIASGTSATTALAQQIPQMLGGFGLWGAAIGAVVAVLGALAPLLFATTEEARDLGGEIEDLEAASSRLDAAMKAQEASTEDLRRKYGEATEAARALLAAQTELAAANQQAAAQSSFEAIFRDLADRLSAVMTIRDNIRAAQAELAAAQADMGGLGAIETGLDPAAIQENIAEMQAALAAAMAETQEQLGLSEEGVRALSAAWAEFYGASEFETATQIEGLQAVRAAIVDNAGELRSLPEPTREFLAQLDAALQRLVEIAARTGELPPHMTQAANDAAGLLGALIPMAGEIDRAVNSALLLGNQFARARNEAAGLLAALPFAMSPDEAAPGFLAPRSGPAPLNTGFIVSPDEPREVPAVPRSPGGGRTIDRAEQEAERARERAARESERAIMDIGRALDRLAPSYQRDVANAEAWRDRTIAALEAAGTKTAEHVAQVDEAFGLMMADAYERDLERRTDWEAGVIRGLRTIREESRDLGRLSEDVVKDIAGGFEDFFTSIVTGTKSAGEAFRDFGNLIMQQIARIAAQRFTSGIVNPLLDALMGGIGGLFGQPAAVQTASLIPGIGGLTFNADGGVYPAPALSQWSNQIVDRPTFFAFARGAALGVMGEAGEEAIMPLRRGPDGRLGVDASAAGGAPVTVNVINNASGTRAEARERTEGGARIVDVMIEQVKAAIAGDITRGAGPIPGALAGTYGLNRVPR